MKNSAMVRFAGLAASVSILSLAALPTSAANWVPINGNVRLADGTPICAMVLANGQYMFSCDGTGAYSLNVPLDPNGQITLFSFADGFAPFRVTTGPASFPYAVQMQAAGPAHSIAGSWDLGNTGTSGVLTFNGDGTYVIVMSVHDCDLPNNPEYFGIEAGTYSYDETTQQLTVLGVARDEIGSCGLANFYTPYPDIRIWRDQGVLWLPEDNLALPKIP